MFTKEMISKGISVVEDCCRTLLRHLTMPAMYFKEGTQRGSSSSALTAAAAASTTTTMVSGITITTTTTKSNPTAGGGLPPKNESTMMTHTGTGAGSGSGSGSVVGSTKEPYGGGGNRLQVLYCSVTIKQSNQLTNQSISQSI